MANAHAECEEISAWEDVCNYGYCDISPGQIVSNFNDDGEERLYQCKSDAASGWCLFEAYEPGTTWDNRIIWDLAYDEVGPISSQGYLNPECTLLTGTDLQVEEISPGKISVLGTFSLDGLGTFSLDAEIESNGNGGHSSIYHEDNLIIFVDNDTQEIIVDDSLVSDFGLATDIVEGAGAAITHPTFGISSGPGNWLCKGACVVGCSQVPPGVDCLEGCFSLCDAILQLPNCQLLGVPCN